MQKFKNYEPLAFKLPKARWTGIARALGGNIKRDIEHKMKFDEKKLMFFQTDMEKLMYEICKAGYNWSKEALQMQINEYIKNEDWK